MLLAIAFVVYWPALDGDFVWDDDAHVTKPGLRTAPGLVAIWTDPSATQQYYPLTHSGFWLQSLLFEERARGYHVVNVALHALSALLVWTILRRLDVSGALFAALVFVVHPVHVESVAWITEFKNSLSGLFYVSAALAYLKFDPPDGPRDGPRGRMRYALALLLFVLALLSKTVTATLPAALLLIIWWKQGSLSWRRNVVPLIPFLAIGIAVGSMTAWIERTVIGARGEDYAFTLVERVLIAGRVFWFYLAKLLWPVKLIFIYPRWTIEANSFSAYLYPAATLVFVGTAWALRGRIGRGPLTGLLYFGGTLFPVMGFVNIYPFRFSFVADHFQYLASLGIIALVSAGIVRGVGRLGRPVTVVACGIVVATLAWMSWRQAHIYSSMETLWIDTATRNPGCFMAYNNLGYEYSRQGRFDEAEEAYRSAIEVKPDFYRAYFNLARLHGERGRPKQAIEMYERAIRVRPDYPEAYYNLGIELGNLGRYEEAIRAFREAVAARPDFAEAHYNLGIAYGKLGRYSKAVTAFKGAIVHRPHYPEAQLNLGVVLRAMGRPREAIERYRIALASRPDYAEAYNNLGLAWADLGDAEQATSALVTAGNLFGERGRYVEATDAFRAALLQRPDHTEAYFKLGLAYARLGRNADAIASWEAAARLDPNGDLGRAARQSAGKLRKSLSR